MRSLPERTVDAWVVAATTAKFPGALIWAPTPRGVADEAWDLGVHLGTGKIFILEDKAAEPYKTWHTILIDLEQLDRYCDEVEALYELPVYYVLPKPPWEGEATGSSVIPDQAIHRTNPDFATWAYVIRCTHLRQVLGAPAHQESKTLRTSHLPLQNCVTLEAFLNEVHACTAGSAVNPPPPPASPGDDDTPQLAQTTASATAPRQTAHRASSDRLDDALRGGRPIAVFVPEAELPNLAIGAQ